MVADTETDKNANLLAGLCYVPLFGLSIIVSLYVILAKKRRQIRQVPCAPIAVIDDSPLCCASAITDHYDIKHV